MVWRQKHCRLSREDEYAHYTTHENNPADPRYRNFLSQLWQPLKQRLPPAAHGLDFGSGPGATLHLMAQEDGFPCTCYDPFFAAAHSRLQQQYDFVTCSETAEHFCHPQAEFALLASLLRPGGWLAVMTLLLQDVSDFPNWFYKNDPTHVCFYQRTTFQWIADNFPFLPPVFISNRVILLQKRA
jgi:SAM-dependent methyltransferase